MIITINGQSKAIEDGLNVRQLLQQEGYGDKKIAVARNGGFLPNIAWDQTFLAENDSIEIVAPMQGG